MEFERGRWRLKTTNGVWQKNDKWFMSRKSKMKTEMEVEQLKGD